MNNLFKRIAYKLATLVSGKKSEAESTQAPDFSNPPPKFLVSARPAIRRKTWFRLVVKHQLKQADISKMEKRQLRKNLFQGHWSFKSLMNRRQFA